MRGLYLCPISQWIRHAMLRPEPLSPAGECRICSAFNWGSSLRSHIIAYWLLSAWHLSHCSAVDVSSPTYNCSMSVLRNNCHLFKPWRLTTGQGYCIIKSVLPLRYSWTVNESASNEGWYQIDTRLFWYPAKNHQTGHLNCLGLALCIHLEWIRSSDTFKYHYLCKGRTPNITSLPKTSDPTIVP